MPAVEDSFLGSPDRKNCHFKIHLNLIAEESKSFSNPYATITERGLTGHFNMLHTSIAKVGYFTDIRLSNLTTPDPDHQALPS